MRKIRIIEHISLDGVIQAPGGPEEDPRTAFRRAASLDALMNQAVVDIAPFPDLREEEHQP
jgi:hypothetical protein